MAELWSQQKRLMGEPVEYEANGIDNSGKLVKKSSCAADFKLKTGELFEVKNSYLSSKITFKVYHLQKYIEQGANILLFYGTDKLDGQHENFNWENARWAWITPDSIQKMLDENEHYKEWSFGNKLCVKVLAKDFDKYFTSNKFMNEV